MEAALTLTSEYARNRHNAFCDMAFLEFRRKGVRGWPFRPPHETHIARIG